MALKLRSFRYQKANTSNPNDEAHSIALHDGTSVREVTSAKSSELTLSIRQKPHTNWNPPFLRTWVLAGFTVFFVLVIVALQIIFSVSQGNEGISTTDDGKYYLWTYGPTAVFVVVTVLWRQVDYAAKSIQPWAEMAKGPKSADDTLLLDYITLFQPVAAYKAIRRKHFAVFSTILVFSLIKVMIIVSTGIFNLRSIRESGVATSMLLNNSFDQAANIYKGPTSVDSRATFVVYGNLLYNVSLPLGTTDQFAAQSFAPQDSTKNGSLTYTANVDAFSAGLDCEVGDLTYKNSFSLSNGNTPVASFYNSTIITPDCQVHGAILDAPDWYFIKGEPSQFGYYGSLQNVTCDNLAVDDPKRERYMIAAAYSRGDSQDNNTLLDSSNIICLPTYRIQKATVTTDVSGNLQNVQLLDSPSRQLDGVSGSDIARGVLKSVQSSYGLASPSGSDEAYDVFINLLVKSTTDFHPKLLLNSSFLEEQGQMLYGKLAAQFANLYLLSPSPSHSPIEGSVTLTRNRLLAVQTPIRWMQGIAGVIIILTLIVLLTRPRNVIPRSVESITAVASILARSPDLQKQLRGTGHLDLKELRKVLDGHHYETVIDSSNEAKTFYIQSSEYHDGILHDSEVDQGNSSIVSYIRPLALHRIAISFIIMMSVAAIVACEVLLSESNKNEGLANVSDDAVTRYSWLYIPVLVFVLLGTLFNVMDFELEFSQSYYALSRGFCDARSSMLWYPLRHISLYTLWNGLKHSRFALTASSLSSILAPFLTIVVAGLFHTISVQETHPVTVTALDFFDLSGAYNPNNVIPALVIEGNMSYPQWTYDELAFPHLKFDVQDFGNAATDGLINVIAPAIRARVDCSVFPQDKILETAFEYGSLSINISTPDECGNSGFNDKPHEYIQENIEVPVNTSGYFGYTLALGFAPSCPTTVIFYGHVTSQTLDNFTAVACTQGLERLDVNTTFSYPDLRIPSDIPPQPLEDTASNFSDYRDGFPQFQQLNITSSDISNTSKLDGVVNAMIYGRDGTPAAELLNSTTLIKSFTHLYRQYMAQSVNANFRANFSSLQPLNATVAVNNPLQGKYTYSYTDSSHLRLVQSPLSTHILVGVLAALLICAVTILLTVDMRKVLPKPVGSIAAVASLLAGSRIVDPASGLVPPGAEWLSDDEWKKRGIWNGEMFRMGWWDQFGQPVQTWDEKFNADFSSDGDLNQRGRDPVFMIDAKRKTIA